MTSRAIGAAVVPPVPLWFCSTTAMASFGGRSSSSPAKAEQLLKSARAAFAIRGTLRKAYTDKPFAQQFVQWVVEMPTAEEANTLVEYVGVNTRLAGRFVTGVASGRLFSLFVARSSIEGVEPFESPESLASIANEARALLHEAAR